MMSSLGPIFFSWSKLHGFFVCHLWYTLRRPCLGKFRHYMALKQWHRTAEMVTSYTKMGWTVTVTEKSANTDSDMASSSICKMTVFKIQMRDIRNPTKRTSLRTLTTTFLSSFRLQTKAEKSNQVILFYLQYLFSTYHWFGCFYYFLFNFF